MSGRWRRTLPLVASIPVGCRNVGVGGPRLRRTCFVLRGLFLPDYSAGLSDSDVYLHVQAWATDHFFASDLPHSEGSADCALVHARQRDESIHLVLGSSCMLKGRAAGTLMSHEHGPADGHRIPVIGEAPSSKCKSILQQQTCFRLLPASDFIPCTLAAWIGTLTRLGPIPGPPRPVIHAGLRQPYSKSHA